MEAAWNRLDFPCRGIYEQADASTSPGFSTGLALDKELNFVSAQCDRGSILAKCGD